MSCIVFQTNKKTGTKYAYRSTSYRDPSTGRPRSRREYLGRVDPVTGEIIPKRSDGGRNTTSVGVMESDESVDLVSELRKTREEARRNANRVAELEAENKALRATIADIRALAQELSSALEESSIR